MGGQAWSLQQGKWAVKGTRQKSFWRSQRNGGYRGGKLQLR